MTRPTQVVTRTVEITEADIRAGRPKNCAMCPAAIAANRVFPELAQVEVFELETRGFIKNGSRLETLTYCLHTDAVKEFIDTYDEGGKVEPLAFQLTLAVPVSVTPSTTP